MEITLLLSTFRKASDSPKVEEDADSESDILRFWTMRFADSEVEKGYHLVMVSGSRSERVRVNVSRIDGSFLRSRSAFSFW